MWEPPVTSHTWPWNAVGGIFQVAACGRMEGRRRDRQLDRRLQPPYKVLVMFRPSGLQCLPSGEVTFQGLGLGLKS